MVNCSIAGASGYAGGELLRILLGHPQAKVGQVTSQANVGLPVSLVHPNLRQVTDMCFVSIADLKPCDVLFLALPNGRSMEYINKLQPKAEKIIDCGADFRLHDLDAWHEWYKKDHCAGELLSKFVYGLPEIHREEVAASRYIACPGCEALVSILALWPLLKNSLVDPGQIIIDAKMSSSQSGNKASNSTHHPERAGVVRSYAPTGHRHTVEIEQELTFGGIRPKIMVSATALDMVRGILVTIHTFLKKRLSDQEVWQIYQHEYSAEPFIRMVKQKSGLYRYPEPKILQGTNFCEIGFEIDNHSNRLVVMGAIDNLVKGTAGNAVQCMNIMLGLKETMGLEFPGLHPI